MIESTYEDNGSALIVALENVFKWGLATWQILLSYSSVAVRKTFAVVVYSICTSTVA